MLFLFWVLLCPCSKLPRAEPAAAHPTLAQIELAHLAPTVACYFLPHQQSFSPGSGWHRAWVSLCHGQTVGFLRWFCCSPAMGTALQQTLLMKTLANHHLLCLCWYLLDFSGSLMPLQGSSLLLAACQECGFGK